MIVSSRSGLVESSVTGASTSSSIRRTYFTACAGRSAQERAPRVEPDQPSIDLVFGLGRRLRSLSGWQTPEYLAVDAVSGADFQLRQPVQHVELGQGDPIDAADLHRLPHQHRVEPAAAPPPPRDRAELVAPVARIPARCRHAARSGTDRSRRGWSKPSRSPARTHRRRVRDQSRKPRSPGRCCCCVTNG